MRADADKIRAIYKFRLDTITRIFENGKLEKENVDAWQSNNPDLVDFSSGLYKIAKNRFNADDYAITTYTIDEDLPWDIIEINPGKNILKERYKTIFEG